MINLPLHGHTVAVTRPAHQQADLVAALAEAGAEVVSLPTIAIVDPEDQGKALRAAVADLADVQWLVLTSANAVDRVAPLLPSWPAHLCVAVIGEATSQRLLSYGVKADLVPESAVGESLLAALVTKGPAKVLVARAAGARDVVPDGLRSAGWDVVVVEAYQSVAAQPSADAILAAQQADVIIFTSPSTVTQFVALVPPSPRDRRAVVIGPVTAEAARSHGFTVGAVAEDASVGGLVAAVLSTVQGTP